MSLNSDETSGEDLSLKIKLRSADQYPLWLARITDLCWAKTKIDISSVKDTDCGAKVVVASYGRGRKSSLADDSDDEKEGLPPWVQKCWLIITTSLHDEVYLKVQHIKRGMIASLLNEIHKCVLLCATEEIVPTRINLYAATMEREGRGDLQTFIAYLKTKQNKLTALGDPLKEGEMVGIFLNGLTPLFHPIVVVLGGVVDAMPKTLDDAIERARKFASQPAVAAELSRGKTPGSQHVYTSFSGPPPPVGQKPLCKLFAMGKCRFGDQCKFFHQGVPKSMNHSTRARFSSQKNLTCAYCKKTGHSVRRCVSKFLTETAKETPPRPIT